jgi:SSS family solute:Na+ symporter
LPTQYAIDLQLLGGLWILQTFPAVVFGLFTNWFRAPALLAGWVVGIGGGSWLVFAGGLKPVHTIVIGGSGYSVYIGLLALVANIVVAAAVNAAVAKGKAAQASWKGVIKLIRDLILRG